VLEGKLPLPGAGIVTDFLWEDYNFVRLEVSILKEKKNGDDVGYSTWKLRISRESEEAV
jgi:hypothetical protein